MCFVPRDLINELEKRKQTLGLVTTAKTEENIFDAINKMMEGLYSLRAQKIGQKSGQLSIEEIMRFINENKEMIEVSLTDPEMIKAYPEFDTKIHGMNHIEDVILFTNLIAPRVFKDPMMVRNAIEAAKYHDSGRVDDKKSDHALASAEKALEILEGKEDFTKRDLAIIYTAICAHDAHAGRELRRYVERVFLDISKRIGNNDVSKLDDVYKLVVTLRDADALDRTRFRQESKAFLDVRRLSPLGQEYVNFALRVSEVHAEEKIKEMIQNGIITLEYYHKMSKGKDLVQALSDIEHDLRHRNDKEKGTSHGKR